MSTSRVPKASGRAGAGASCVATSLGRQPFNLLLNFLRVGGVRRQFEVLLVVPRGCRFVTFPFVRLAEQETRLGKVRSEANGILEAADRGIEVAPGQVRGADFNVLRGGERIVAGGGPVRFCRWGCLCRRLLFLILRLGLLLIGWLLPSRPGGEGQQKAEQSGSERGRRHGASLAR